VHLSYRSAFLCLASLLFHLAVQSQDCSLAGFLTQGISNSPVLKDLSNQILTNQYDSLIARASLLPQVYFNGALMYAPSINGWGYSEVSTNGKHLTGTFDISQQVLNKKTREANFEKYGIESGNPKNISHEKQCTIIHLHNHDGFDGSNIISPGRHQYRWQRPG
jgi:hypothetical protein